jgi:FkbM family methyltransferase
MSKLLQTAVRDFLLQAFALQPLALRQWLMSHFQRLLLKVFFSLNTDTITLSPAGLPPHRFRMWLNWQGSLDYALGLYEPEAMQSIRRMVNVGDCCIDVGANLGYYTISLAKWVGPNGLVVAFEPFPGNFAILEKNVHLNQLQKVILEPSAVSDCNGSLELVYGIEEQFSATPSVGGYAIEGDRESIRVPTRRLDDYIRALGRVPRFIKVDVEGAELTVLEGARHTLTASRPILLVEIHGWGTDEAARVLQFISELQYETQVLGQKGRERVVLCTVQQYTSPTMQLLETKPDSSSTSSGSLRGRRNWTND